MEQNSALTLPFNIWTENDDLFCEVLSKLCFHPSVLWAEALCFLCLLENQILDLLTRCVQKNVKLSPDDIFGNVDSQWALALISINFCRLCYIVNYTVGGKDLIWAREQLVKNGACVCFALVMGDSKNSIEPKEVFCVRIIWKLMIILFDWWLLNVQSTHI